MCIGDGTDNHTRDSSFFERQISVFIQLISGHLRNRLAGVRPSKTSHLTVCSAQINHSEEQRSIKILL